MQFFASLCDNTFHMTSYIFCNHSSNAPNILFSMPDPPLHSLSSASHQHASKSIEHRDVCSRCVPQKHRTPAMPLSTSSIPCSQAPGLFVSHTSLHNFSWYSIFSSMLIEFSLVWFDFDRRSFGPSYRLFRLAKKGRTIQYGYRTWGTHARVFSQTLMHGNSKNEIRQWDRQSW